MHKASVALGTLLLTSVYSQGALTAHYDFADGDRYDNEVSAAFTLTETSNGTNVITTTPEGAVNFPGETGAERDFLATPGPGGAASFTVSIWFKTNTVNQGGFQGIFSNLTPNAPNNFSWQLDVNNGTLRIVAATTGFGSLTNAEDGEPGIQAGIWNHVIARKTSSGGAELWLGSENTAPELVGSGTINPGGLQNFRLGVNRNNDSLYAMEMANVKIYDDANVSLTDLNGEGPQLIPEPSTSFLGLFALCFAFHRKRT